MILFDTQKSYDNKTEKMAEIDNELRQAMPENSDTIFIDGDKMTRNRKRRYQKKFKIKRDELSMSTILAHLEPVDDYYLVRYCGKYLVVAKQKRHDIHYRYLIKFI